MNFTFTAASPAESDIRVIPVRPDHTHSDLPRGLKTSLYAIIDRDKNFKGKSGETLVVRTPEATIMLLGLGKTEELRETSAALSKALAAEKAQSATIDMEGLFMDESMRRFTAAHLADGLLLNSYTFDEYKTPDPEKVSLEQVTIVTAQAGKAQKQFEALRHVTDGHHLASNFVNEPSNVLYPATYAQRIKAAMPENVQVQIIGPEEMKDLGMGAALAVGQGSARPPRIVIMTYDGGGLEQPVALVGKGMTYDSGGLNIKTSGMEEMTMDMAGSAAVVGAMYTAAARKAKLNIVAVVALAENMPSGNAYKPGDIIKTMNGKSVYINDTDAEGRLVLADALTYVQQKHNPGKIIDLATLTGAALTALGTEIAAVYTNNDNLYKVTEKASEATGEQVWRMPLRKQFTKAVRKTPQADLRNYVPGWGGSCTAAAFLEQFIDKGRTWEHIDMAGPGIPEDKVLKGWGVALIDDMLQQFEAEQKKPATPAAQPRSLRR